MHACMLTHFPARAARLTAAFFSSSAALIFSSCSSRFLRSSVSVRSVSWMRAWLRRRASRARAATAGSSWSFAAAGSFSLMGTGAELVAVVEVLRARRAAGTRGGRELVSDAGCELESPSAAGPLRRRLPSEDRRRTPVLVLSLGC